MSIKVIRYRLPSYWACPLINDDYTGLTDEECEEIQRFLEAAEGYPVDEDKQEMDAKHLDCLVPIRKLELQEYLSPEILKMEHI